MKSFNNNAIKGTILLIAVILVASALARFMNSQETLDDYAKKHPEEQVKVEIIELPDKEPLETPTISPEVSEVLADDASEIELEAIEESKPVDAYINDEYDNSADRVYIDEGFYYEPIPVEIKEKMYGLSYPEDIDEEAICYDDLRYVCVLYKDFDGNACNGQLVCNELIARDLTEIFSELFKQDYRFENIKLIDEYDADDVLSMSDNNTSCFCYRVVDGTSKMSDHAYGMAIDINPFYNPYVVFKSGGDDYISPPGSEIYADRSEDNINPYRIDENDLAYKLFKEHGFKWGGDWNSMKDYQHFYKKIS